MVWLAAQMWILLGLSLILGLLIGWWIANRQPRTPDDDSDIELAQLRSRIEECEAEKNKLRAQSLEYETERRKFSPPKQSDKVEPLLYETATDGAADDLKKINGIGPQLEKMLNELGVYYFHQIASWTDQQTDYVDDKLRFKGRITRDNWRGQARSLTTFPQTRE